MSISQQRCADITVQYPYPSYPYPFTNFSLTCQITVQAYAFYETFFFWLTVLAINRPNFRLLSTSLVSKGQVDRSLSASLPDLATVSVIASLTDATDFYRCYPYPYPFDPTKRQSHMRGKIAKRSVFCKLVFWKLAYTVFCFHNYRCRVRASKVPDNVPIRAPLYLSRNSAACSMLAYWRWCWW